MRSTYADHTAPRPHTTLELLRTAEFSDVTQVLDCLAHSDVPSEVLRKIAHNPAATEGTLELLIELDERWLTYPVTRRTDLSPEFIDRIARLLTDRNAIFHVSSAPNAAPETLRYLAEHLSARSLTGGG